MNLLEFVRKLFLKRKRRVAIAAVLKTEAPYLLEWIAFHRVVGIERFYLADNVSEDGTSELLIALDKAGIIERVPFPSEGRTAPQIPAYAKLLNKYRKQADWIALIDCDEFLLPTGNAVSVHDLLAWIERDWRAGAICLNWAMYGSSHMTEPANEPVISRFTMRAEEQKLHNHIYKSFVRTRAYRSTDVNPHHFRLRWGYRAVQSDGRPLQVHENGFGLSAAVVWDRMRLNHYFVKSKAEFDLIKRPRGRPDLYDTRRPASEFDDYDYNEVYDPVPDWLVRNTRDEMEVLRNSLRAVGCSEALVLADTRIREQVRSLAT